jgi:L-seryl-tRNA(Ser) seleniumtransferase
MSANFAARTGSLTRRGFIGWARSIAAAAGVSPFLPYSQVIAFSESAPTTDDYYDKLGVAKIINAAGTYTTLTAACMPPVVLAASSRAAA